MGIDAEVGASQKVSEFSTAGLAVAAGLQVGYTLRTCLERVHCMRLCMCSHGYSKGGQSSLDGKDRYMRF